jgi:glc operon protein GlcG
MNHVNLSRIGVPTDAFLERLHRDNIEISFFGDSFFTALPGGVPLKNADDIIIGGAGISGLAANEDQAIANYLAEQLPDILTKHPL